MVRAAALGGWTRLGIVISGPLCLLAGALQWEMDDQLYAHFNFTAQKAAAAKSRVEASVVREQGDDAQVRSGKLPPPIVSTDYKPISKDTPAERENRIFWNAVESDIDLSRCTKPAESQYFQYSSDYAISCPKFPDLFKVAAAAALPVGILFAFGAVIGWVFRGFRQEKAT